MDNLYEIVSVCENEVSIRLHDASHPIFKAHFPDMPLLPAFVSLDIIQEIFHLQITEVKKAKFLKPILPEQTITYSRDKNTFKIYRDGEMMASLSVCVSAL